MFSRHVIATNMNNIFNLVSFDCIPMACNFLPFLFRAEKSGNGSEEGQLERADHDDSFLGDSFHYPLRLGVLDLRGGV